MIRRIKKRSAKKRARDRAWSVIVKAAIALVDGWCPVRSPWCTRYCEGGHHILPLGRGGQYTKENCLPCCNGCNLYIHRHEQWARERGFIKGRTVAA